MAVRQKPAQPAPVAQRGVETNEAHLVSSGVDKPAGVGLRAHRLPDLVGKVVRQRDADGGAERESERHCLRGGIIEARPGGHFALTRREGREREYLEQYPTTSRMSCFKN